MRQSTALSFDNLLEDVINKGLCNRCEACVSFCNAEQIGAIGMCDCPDGLPKLVGPARCFHCGICYLICPQTKELNEKVRKDFDWSAPAGNFQDILSGRTTDDKLRDILTEGNVAAAILAYMFENKIIDYAIVPKKTGPFNREPEIVCSYDDLIKLNDGKSQFDNRGKKYSTSVNVLSLIRMFGPKRNVKLAVVCNPCQVMAIRKMQTLNIIHPPQIHFVIGLFCAHCLAFDSFDELNFIKERHINPDDIADFNCREDFELLMKSGESINIPYKEIESVAKPVCRKCREFASDLADVSVGSLGSSEGYTSSVIRTDLAQRIFNDAVNDGYIETADISEVDKANIMSHVAAFAERKRVRSEAPDEEAMEVINVDELCSECEELNRHLNWVVSFVSHELNATLGTIIMNISALEEPEIARKLNEDKKRKLILGALNSLKLMQDMVRNYLASAKAKSGQLDFNPCKVNVGKDIINAIVKRLGPTLKMRNMDFVCDRCDKIETVCDKRLISIAINNLISNAIKYGTKGTTIHGAMRRWNDGFEYSITNEGIGIPEDKLEKIFDEYSRFDSLGVGGTGLGLFLVKRIAQMHNGKIEANAGYIIDDEYVTYDMIRENPDKYDIDLDDKNIRRFATFKLCIADCAQTESGSMKREKG